MSIHHQEHDVTLHAGHVLDVLPTLDATSVNCVVTSPPYFGLRDYGVDGQIGLEQSPAEYVAALVDVFREVRRVLRDDGVVWLNLGDSYSTPKRGTDEGCDKSRLSNPARVQKMQFAALRQTHVPEFDRPSKSLLGIPWRVAFALQDDGWILRQEIIWAKRNCMPENVKDRPSRSHETVFLLSKRKRYWYDADAIREESDPDQEAHNERYAKVYDAQAERARTTGQPGNQNSAGIHSRPGPSGRNARSVWTISSQPFPGAHFATMPPALARRCILAGCPEDGTVLDPFTGSGTTGMVARQTGRRFVGIDLNAAYLDLAIQRIGDPVLNFGASA